MAKVITISDLHCLGDGSFERMVTEIEDFVGEDHRRDLVLNMLTERVVDDLTDFFINKARKRAAMEPQDSPQIVAELLSTNFKTNSCSCVRKMTGKGDNWAKAASRKRCLGKADNKQELPGSKRHKSNLIKTQKPTTNLHRKIQSEKPLFNPDMGMELNQFSIVPEKQSKKCNLDDAEANKSKPPLKKWHLKMSKSGRWHWCD